MLDKRDASSFLLYKAANLKQARQRLPLWGGFSLGGSLSLDGFLFCRGSILPFVFV